jgi:hypothetical protein
VEQFSFGCNGPSILSQRRHSIAPSCEDCRHNWPVGLQPRVEPWNPGFNFLIRQKNLWVSSGSGSLPSE